MNKITLTADDQRKLRKVSLFREFNETEFNDITKSASIIELDKNALLYKRHDPTNAFYILLHGHLHVTLVDKSGNDKIIGEINENEVVGEMSLITDDLRSATIYASRRSRLVCLTKDKFDILWHNNPEILKVMIKQIVLRLQKLTKSLSGDQLKRHFMLVGNNKDINLPAFIESIKAINDGSLKIIEYNDIAKYIHNHSKQDLLQYLDNLDQEYNTLLFIYKKDQPDWNANCIALSDRLIVVADATKKSLYSDETKILLDDPQAFNGQNTELILLHPKSTNYPKDTATWLKDGHYFRHHHARKDNDADTARLYRYLTGKAIALVLAGGGSRSMSQLGVLKAFEEYGIPIDCVGGASQGAINCWLISTGKPYKWIVSTLISTLPLFKSCLKKFTLPLYAILSANSATKALQDSTEGTHMEDMWKLNFSVSVDLSHRKEAIFSQGPAWKSIRASISLPAVFIPVAFEGSILVDGSVMNNMPVDIMKDQFLHNDGLVIAIDLENKTRDTKYQIPDKYSFLKILLGKLGVKKYQSNIPSIFDTLLRSLLVTAHNKTQENGALADILITLPVSNYKLLDYDEKKVDTLIAIGYKAAIEEIKRNPALQKLAKESKPQKNG